MPDPGTDLDTLGTLLDGILPLFRLWAFALALLLGAVTIALAPPRRPR